MRVGEGLSADISMMLANQHGAASRTSNACVWTCVGIRLWNCIVHALTLRLNSALRAQSQSEYAWHGQLWKLLEVILGCALDSRKNRHATPSIASTLGAKTQTMPSTLFDGRDNIVIHRGVPCTAAVEWVLPQRNLSESSECVTRGCQRM